MISKQQFLDSLLLDFKILSHLYQKITPKMLDYRPSPKQRSLLELLQYLSHFVSIEAQAIASGSAINDFQGAMAEAYQMPAEKFLEQMKKQEGLIKEVFDRLTEEQMHEEIDLFGRGRPQARSLWFLNLILKSLTAYKMQLFLYLKANGLHNLNTSNLWRGEDTAPQT